MLRHNNLGGTADLTVIRPLWMITVFLLEKGDIYVRKV